jgi:hypothetical protein
MDIRANEEANRPLGVFGCLMAGFEMLGQNWWLLILPTLLDLFFWWGPQLSIEPLIRDMASLLSRQPAPSPEAARQLLLMVQALNQFGEQFNLFSLVSMLPILSPPSLLVHHPPGITSPVGQRAIVSVTNVLTLTGWGAVLIPIGLLLGFAYLHSLARSVYTLHSAKEETPDSDSQEQESTVKKHQVPGCNVALKLVRILLFAIGLVVAGMIFFPIWVTALGIVWEIGTGWGIAEILSFLVGWLGIGIISFIMLHLLFVIHGVLLGERGLFRAMLESIALVRAHPFSSISLILITVLIYQMLRYVWSLPSGDSWLLLVGILGNSCIATALITGSFVFYQERIDLLLGTPPLKND